MEFLQQEGRFSKCDVCTAIKEGRERTLDPTVRKWLSDILDKHLKLERFVWGINCCFDSDIALLYRNEREKYAKHRHKSEKYPNKYLSVIIDGMDQDKTDIPHITSNPKAMAGSYRLETHVTGVRAHGHVTMMVIDWGQFPHDTNLTIQVLLQLFDHLKVCSCFWSHISLI